MRATLSLLRETVREFNEDKAPRLGAALAYYTIFSIGPLLLIAVAMAGLVLGPEAAQGKVSAQLDLVFGSATSKSVEEMIESAARPKSGTLATVLGILTLFLGASGVFGQLKDALNTIWNVQPDKESGLKAFILKRFLSLTMVLGIGFLLLVSLVFDAAISAMGDYLGRFLGGEAVLQALQLVVSFALAALLFAAIFRVLPDLKIAWRDVWLGAILTSLLFVLGKWALGVYLGKAAVGSSYGAAGSLVILLIWVYWSAQILFFGAEFTQVYARTHGSLEGDTSKRDARAVAERVEDRPRPAMIVPEPVSVHVKTKTGRGLGKLVAGLFIGTFIGGLSAAVLAFKSARKLIMAPFR